MQLDCCVEPFRIVMNPIFEAEQLQAISFGTRTPVSLTTSGQPTLVSGSWGSWKKNARRDVVDVVDVVGEGCLARRRVGGISTDVLIV